MENKGWIKLHRKLTEKGYYKDSEYVHLWIHLLLKATHETKEYLFNNKIEKTQPGQFITGRQKLSQETGISQTKIERILDLFQKDGQIGQQTNSKFRLITINNWEGYQEIGQQMDSQRTASGHIQECKNERMEEKRTLLVEGGQAADHHRENIFYSSFKTACLKRNLTIDLSEARYISLKTEYETKLMWWSEVQKCLAWLFDNHKKNVNANRLRNWMVNSLKFNKERELKARQEFQEKKYSQVKKPLSAKDIPLWTPPL